MFFSHTKFHSKSGFITLISVLIVGTVGLSLGVGLILWGLNASRRSFMSDNYYQAQAVAEGCLETGLAQLQASTTYEGNDTETIGGVNCSYTVTDLGGENRQITASAQVVPTTARGVVLLDAVEPNLHVLSWRWVASF